LLHPHVGDVLLSREFVRLDLVFNHLERHVRVRHVCPDHDLRVLDDHVRRNFFPFHWSIFLFQLVPDRGAVITHLARDGFTQIIFSPVDEFSLSERNAEGPGDLLKFVLRESLALLPAFPGTGTVHLRHEKAIRVQNSFLGESVTFTDSHYGITSDLFFRVS